MNKLDKLAELSNEAFVARAAEMAPRLRERAPADEERRNVAAETIAEIKDGGFFRLLQPKRFGGFERDIGTVVRCSLEWSSGDASSGWVAGLAIIHQWVIALFDIRCQEEVWGENPDAITFGSYAPSGECERVAGGFRISGSWAYASGCVHGDWGLMGVLFPAAGTDGKPSPGFVLVPKSDYVIDDMWDPMGLVASGSNNYVCDGVFVPEHRTITFAQLASGEAPGYLVHRNPLYRYPLLSLIAYAIATPALGCLKGGLESFAAETGDWTTRGAVVRGGAKVARYQGVQMRVGAAAGALKAAKAMLFEQLETSRRRIMEEGEMLGVPERLDNRLTQAYMVHLALKGLDELWGAAGGAGVHKTQYLQRAWRDAHAISHHVTFNWDALTSMYGQHLLGLEPEGQY